MYSPGYTFLEKSKGNVQNLYDGSQPGGSWEEELATQATRQKVESSRHGKGVDHLSHASSCSFMGRTGLSYVS
jgi:hypothetical protein